MRQMLHWARCFRNAVTASDHPLLLTAFVTDRCGLRCRHCLFGEQLNRQAEAALRVEDVERVVRRWPNIPWAIVTGGEPFQVRMLNILIAPLLGPKGVALLTVPTSGRFPSRVEQFVRALDGGRDLPLVSIHVSLYGDRNRHDDVTGIAGSHDRAIQTLRLLERLSRRRRWLVPTIQFTVMRSNQDSVVADLDTLARQFPATRQVVNRVRAPVPDPHELEIDERSLLRALEYAAAHNRRHAVPGWVAGLISFRDTTVQVRPFVRPGTCTAGRRTIVLGPDGRIRGCEWFYDMSLGNIRSDESAELDLQRRAFSDRARRTRCSCSHECLREVGSVDRLLGVLRVWS